LFSWKSRKQNIHVIILLYHILSSNLIKFICKCYHMSSKYCISLQKIIFFHNISFQTIIFQIWELKFYLIFIIFLPDKKKTTMRELMIENQWISTSLMPRYTSHLLAQLTSDCFHSTEYKKRRLVPFGLTNCGLASLGRMQVFPSNFNWDVSMDRASTSNPTTLNSFLQIKTIWSFLSRFPHLCKNSLANVRNRY